MDISEIFNDHFTPKERRELWNREYIRRGLLKFGGRRRKTADYLGVSVRNIRNYLKKFPELLEEFPPLNKPRLEYVPKEKSRQMDLSQRHKYKSIIKFRYVIKSIKYDTAKDIAKAFKVTEDVVNRWLDRRCPYTNQIRPLTSDNDVIRVTSYPVDRLGREMSVEDFPNMDSREFKASGNI